MSNNQQNTVKKAILYRNVTDKSICPHGIKSKALLKKKGYKVIDNHLKTKEEIDNFKKEHDVKTTPQTFIDDKRIGGHDDLLIFFGEDKPKKEKTYTPVLTVFAIAFLLAIATSYSYSLGFAAIIKLFMGFSISILSMLKLQDIERFVNQFITYDLLAKRWLRYAYIYPFAEAVVGIGVVTSIFSSFIAVIAIIISSIGAVSVYLSVYIQKRDLNCACVGGNSKVPLGFLSLTENIMMLIMGVWLLFV